MNLGTSTCYGKRLKRGTAAGARWNSRGAICRTNSMLRQWMCLRIWFPKPGSKGHGLTWKPVSTMRSLVGSGLTHGSEAILQQIADFHAEDDREEQRRLRRYERAKSSAARNPVASRTRSRQKLRPSTLKKIVNNASARTRPRPDLKVKVDKASRCSRRKR